MDIYAKRSRSEYTTNIQLINMSSPERGPVWGGSAIDWQEKKEKQKKEIEMALTDLPIIFDTNNFQDLITHIHLLEKGGVQELQIGEKNYSIEIIKKLIRITIEDFSREEWREKIKNKTMTDESIIQYLKKRGITGNKINEESLQGFRDCMLLCIKHMCT